MPGARAMGRLANNAMHSVAMREANAVAVKTPPAGMPAAERIPGLTARMYAMVMKVVTPAMISVRTVVPCSFTLKKFSTSASLNSRSPRPRSAEKTAPFSVRRTTFERNRFCFSQVRV